eukprot:TRINITY_DN11055_c0_g1_i3.p1 TRINITY_DN11055_c0_g1~~TRINITY_DN11055_c0_g1_i3.p1  ORF type:complete len:135 (+),score=12.72 TRINITY_DN11055_c0_g1_i3:25-429(+)
MPPPAPPLPPAKFYGRELPRPRLYEDIKFNSERIDPPAPVNEALIQWAQEAKWKMGGWSMKKMRMSGRIDGEIDDVIHQEECLSYAETKSEESNERFRRKAPKKQDEGLKGQNNSLWSGRLRSRAKGFGKMETD